MSHIQTSPETSPQLTQHAMLVIWGLFARRIGLVQAIEAVKLKQKTRNHRPQTESVGIPGRYFGWFAASARHQPVSASTGSGPFCRQLCPFCCLMVGTTNTSNPPCL
jgi:hypothetical protein